MIALDTPRKELKENVYKLIIKEGGIPDIVKKTLGLVESFPELASLKKRIKYPDEIDASLTQDLDSTIHHISKELRELSAYYKNNSDLNVRVSSDLIEPCLITQKVALKLLSRSEYGDIIKTNKRGIHPVIAVDGLHLKGECEDPLDSGMEMSVYLIHSLLLGEEIGPCLAPTCVLNFENVQIEKALPPLSVLDAALYCEAEDTNQRGVFFITHPHIQRQTAPRSFLLQASKTVVGKSLEEHLDNLPLFDEENFSALILSSFLTIPTDYKPDNFIVMLEPGKIVAKIIGIDNDMALAFPIIVFGKKQEHSVALKNALYFFEQMMDKPIAPLVREQITNLDPVLFGIKWAAAVFEQAQKYDQMGLKGKHFPLRFTKSTLHQLIENLQTLKKIISELEFKHVTHRQLFRLLFPVVERFYQRFSRSTSTNDRVERLFSNKIGTVEDQLNGKEKLEDGRTVKEALDAIDKKAYSFQEERDTPIETLCYEILKNLDLNSFPIEKQCAILTLTARYFPNIDQPHPSWINSDFPFHIIRTSSDFSALPFLQKLGIDLQGKNREGDTILHLLIKLHRDLPNELMPLIPLDTLNLKKLTPLDLAIERKMRTTIITLIQAGAGSSASSMRAWEFFPFVQKQNYPPLTEAFQKLIQRNSLLEWKMAREAIFPASGPGVPVISPLYGERSLHPNAKDQLWKSGKFQRINIHGRRAVGKISLDGFTLYVKHDPEFPGVEQAVNTLIHQVMGFGAPHCDLVKIEGTPYLVSQGIQGLTLQEVLETAPHLLQKLNKRRLSQLILLTMLINPEDGKPDNYIFNPLPNDIGEYQLVSIDTDRSFVPSVAIQSNKKCVQVKTILYCLDQMFDPIDPSVKEQFLKHDPAEIMKQWLSHLSSLHKLYMDTFSEEERKKCEKLGTFICFPFREEMIASIYRKFVKIQFILDLEKNNPHFTHWDLLKKVDSPVAQRYYEGLKNKMSPMQRFLAIDGKHYEIKKNQIITTTEASELLVSYNIVTKKDMDELIAKGACFDPEKALQKLQEVIQQDRLITIEQEKIDFSSLDDQKITDLLKRTPLSNIPPPVEQSILRQIKQVVWKELSLTSSATLTNAYLKGLDLSKVVSVNLSYCQQLTDQVVEQILNAAPNLEILNLSGIKSLEKIEGTKGVFVMEAATLELNKITHLYLNHCPKLNVVDISGKKLTVVECEGINCSWFKIKSPSLTNLHIKDSNLTSRNLDEVIGGCFNLKRLNLEGCTRIEDKELRDKFPGIPFSIIGEQTRKIIIDLINNGNSNLIYSCDSLSENELIVFSKALSLIPSLDTVQLRNGYYFVNIMEYLLNTLSEHQTITSLSLDAFKIQTRRLVNKPDKGQRGPNIKYVTIPSADDFNEGVRILVTSLQKNKTLKNLALTNTVIWGVGITALANYLKNSPSLTALDLGYNRMTDAGDLSDALRQNTRLQTLNLCGNFHNSINDIIYLAEALKTNYTLTSLNLGYCQINCDGAKALAKTLLRNPTLRSLNLNDNPLGSLGLKEIAGALMHHPLTSLDLRRVKCTELETVNDLLVSIGLYNDKMKLEGLLALAEALKSQNTLTSLNLSYNNLGNKEGEIIADAIKSNNSLVTLDLSNNFLYDAAAVAIAEALKINKSIVSLDLSHNKIGDAGADAITEAVKSNKSIVSLSLSNNDIDERKIVFIKESLKTNNKQPIIEQQPTPGQPAADPQPLPIKEWDSSSTPAIPQTPPSTETLFLQGKVHEQKELGSALALYLEAAHKGHGEALHKLHALKAHFPLGSYFESKKKTAQAAYYYSLAAAEGDLDGKEALDRLALADPHAKSLLASLLEKGSGMKMDIDKAIVLHKAAAAAGVEVSKLHLGKLYYMGFSTEADQKAALSWIEKANLENFPEENLVKKALLNEIRAKEKIFQSGATIDQKLYQLSCHSKVLSSSNTIEQEALLNQKKRLVHSGFTEKISHIFAAVDALVKGAQIQIPLTGISQYAIEKFLGRENREKVKEKCLRIQSCYPESGSLSTALASGFVFRFQELIHQLDVKSLDKFIDHYILIFTDYLFEKAPIDATNFELLIGGALQKATTFNRFFAKKLKTDRGVEYAIEDLFFSSGLRTLYGGIYHPKGIDSPPFYRWGTKEEVEILKSMGNEMVQIAEERIDHLVAKVDRKLAAARYLQEADHLAKLYLEEK